MQTSFLVTYYGLSIYILNHPVISTAVSPPTPAGDYDIGLEQLVSMSKDQNTSAFQQYGGASQKHFAWLLIEMLKLCALLTQSSDILSRLEAYQI